MVMKIFCNLNCEYCDTDFSQIGGKSYTKEELINITKNAFIPLITGNSKGFRSSVSKVGMKINIFFYHKSQYLLSSLNEVASVIKRIFLSSESLHSNGEFEEYVHRLLQ